jgi:hypothetical protein
LYLSEYYSSRLLLDRALRRQITLAAVSPSWRSCGIIYIEVEVCEAAGEVYVGFADSRCALVVANVVENEEMFDMYEEMFDMWLIVPDGKKKTFSRRVILLYAPEGANDA